MKTPPPRFVTLVVIDADSHVHGALPPFQVATPWWMDMAPVVSEVRRRHDIGVTVLRILSSELPAPHGGAVTYLVQIHADERIDDLASDLSAWHGVLNDDRLRVDYARVNGPDNDLNWARSVLNELGDTLVGDPVQHRTWNLSSVWELPTRNGGAWLKVVPPLFAHEGALLGALNNSATTLSTASPVPALLGRDGPRILLANIPGSDRYDAPLAERLAMIDILVELQAPWINRQTALLALGLPDWRGPALTAALIALIERRAHELDEPVRRRLYAFATDLPRRFAGVAECGLDDGLVHGDFHPGNVRGNEASLTIIDWADSGIGHPLLDQPAFLAVAPPEDHDTIKTHWSKAWKRAVPGCLPMRAASLLAPIACARQAVIYERFLDSIENSERPYHESDVADWLTRAAALLP